MNKTTNAIDLYDFETFNTNVIKSEYFNQYKTYKEFLFGTDTKLSYGDRKYLNGYINAINDMSTCLGKEMFIMSDTSINNSMILNKIDELGDKLNNKIDEKVDKLDDKLNEKIDKLDDKIDNTNLKISTINANIDYMKEDIGDLKEDTKDLPIIKQNVEQLMNKNKWWKQYLVAPLITGTLVAVIAFLLNKFVK